MNLLKLRIKNTSIKIIGAFRGGGIIEAKLPGTWFNKIYGFEGVLGPTGC